MIPKAATREETEAGGRRRAADSHVPHAINPQELVHWGTRVSEVWDVSLDPPDCPKSQNIDTPGDISWPLGKGCREGRRIKEGLKVKRENTRDACSQAVN